MDRKYLKNITFEAAKPGTTASCESFVLTLLTDSYVEVILTIDWVCLWSDETEMKQMKARDMKEGISS